jgi:hypothetical protein
MDYICILLLWAYTRIFSSDWAYGLFEYDALYFGLIAHTRRQVNPNRWLNLNRLHGVVSQNTKIFMKSTVFSDMTLFSLAEFLPNFIL